jgi:hypothetical protein
VQGEEVLTSRFPRRKGGFTVPGPPLAGGYAQEPRKLDGAVAPSPVSVDQCPVVQLPDPRLASIRVGPSVQPLQGENYTYSRILGHEHLLIRLRFHRVVLLLFSTSH